MGKGYNPNFVYPKTRWVSIIQTNRTCEDIFPKACGAWGTPEVSGDERTAWGVVTPWVMSCYLGIIFRVFFNFWVALTWHASYRGKQYQDYDFVFQFHFMKKNNRNKKFQLICFCNLWIRNWIPLSLWWHELFWFTLNYLVFA